MVVVNERRAWDVRAENKIVNSIGKSGGNFQLKTTDLTKIHIKQQNIHILLLLLWFKKGIEF